MKLAILMNLLELPKRFKNNPHLVYLNRIQILFFFFLVLCLHVGKHTHMKSLTFCSLISHIYSTHRPSVDDITF